MSQGAWKGIGAGCLVLCAILMFVAWERYQDNAQKVEAANSMMQSSSLGGESPLGGMLQQMTGSGKLEPGVPAATTYSLLFGALAGIGGVVCLVAAGKAGPGLPARGASPAA